MSLFDLTDTQLARASWMTDALCARPGVDPETFFPNDGQNPNHARRICRDCPVTADCLSYARAHEFHDGVWGGQSPRERAKYRARLRGAA